LNSVHKLYTIKSILNAMLLYGKSRFRLFSYCFA
jgi:hypothetical protein